MKKKMAMAVMALAVSAMAGSAFASDEMAKIRSTAVPMKVVHLDGAQAMAKPVINLVELAKEKGISEEELIEQMKKEGTIIDRATASVKIEANGKQVVTVQKAISLEQMAKEKGISVEELIKQLEKEGKIKKAIKTVPATKK